MLDVLVRAHSFVIDRGAAVHADVELDLRAGLPGLAVIGLGGGPARDLRERVQAAVLNSGFAFPRRRVTVNIAPPVSRGGAQLDLAVACCVLAAGGELAPSRIEPLGLCAELALGGELRGSGAGGAIAEAAAALGLAGVLMAPEDREAALLSEALPVACARDLAGVVRILRAPPRGGSDRRAQSQRREGPRGRHPLRSDRRPP